jgi:hypothetical protein
MTAGQTHNEPGEKIERANLYITSHL